MISCLIIDDEPLALELMVDNVSRVSFLRLEGTCNNVIEAMTIMNEKQIDLIFLDIEMPSVNGITFLKTQKVSPMVIITTAYEKYALDGFELDVIDYLLKPIGFERFLKAVSKAAEYQCQQTNQSGNNGIKYLFVKSEHRIVKITISEIRYIESMKDYVKIYIGEKPIYSIMSMKKLEEILPSNEFARVHRSFIVSLSHIDFVGKSKIVMESASIPVSNYYRESFLKLLKNE
ncbi:MAG: DNA-binding response regulator [Bacteroidetes bacterium HGW-Bacteroidetes-6]|jgi:DNA-binding LytR/AlgR family response regulator|nr:MAG: DNA-binding response regulator [Bacteroidetes bacterium HGW-Bacteroidetes-6]